MVKINICKKLRITFVKIEKCIYQNWKMYFFPSDKLLVWNDPWRMSWMVLDLPTTAPRCQLTQNWLTSLHTQFAKNYRQFLSKTAKSWHQLLWTIESLNSTLPTDPLLTALPNLPKIQIAAKGPKNIHPIGLSFFFIKKWFTRVQHLLSLLFLGVPWPWGILKSPARNGEKNIYSVRKTLMWVEWLQ